MLRRTLIVQKRKVYPHSCGELDWHQISSFSITTSSTTTTTTTMTSSLHHHHHHHHHQQQQQESPPPFSFQHKYLPLSAVSGGRFAGPTEYLLRERALDRNFRSQFWITEKQLYRQFGGRILPSEKNRGVDIGLGRGPMRLFAIDDIEGTDMQLFLRIFPLSSSSTGAFFNDSDQTAGALVNHAGTLVRVGQHKIFDGLKWQKYSSPELNFALDVISKQKVREEQQRGQEHMNTGSGEQSGGCSIFDSSNNTSFSPVPPSDSPSSWIFEDIVLSRQMSVKPGRRAVNAFEVVLDMAEQQQRLEQQQRQLERERDAALAEEAAVQHQPVGAAAALPSPDENFMEAAMNAWGSAPPRSDASREWEAATSALPHHHRQQQQQQDPLDHNGVPIRKLNHVAIARASIVYNAEQCDAHDVIENTWSSLPLSDVSEIHGRSGELTLSFHRSGSVSDPSNLFLQQHQEETGPSLSAAAAAAAAAASDMFISPHDTLPQPPAPSPPVEQFSFSQQQQQQQQQPPQQEDPPTVPHAAMSQPYHQQPQTQQQNADLFWGAAAAPRQEEIPLQHPQQQQRPPQHQENLQAMPQLSPTERAAVLGQQHHPDLSPAVPFSAAPAAPAPSPQSSFTPSEFLLNDEFSKLLDISPQKKLQQRRSLINESDLTSFL